MSGCLRKSSLAEFIVVAELMVVAELIVVAELTRGDRYVGHKG